VEAGLEKAVAAALASRASALLADDPRAGLALLERAREEGLGRLDVIVAGARPRSVGVPVLGAEPLAAHVSGDEGTVRLLEGVWLVDAAQLLQASAGIVVTREGHGYDMERGELWFAGQAGEAIQLELDARRRALADEAEELEARAGAAAREADEAAARAEAAEAVYREAAHLRGESLDAALLGRLAALADALAAHTARAGTSVGRIEAPVSASLAAGSRRSEELGEELRRLAAIEAAARHEANDAGRRAAEAEVVLARLGGAPVMASAAAGRSLEELVEDAWRIRAPKRLVAEFDSPG